MTTLITRIPVTLPEHAPPFSRDILTLRARLALATGDQAFVQRWVADLGQSSRSLFPFSSEREALVMVRWHLVQGREEQALELVQRVRACAEEARRRQSTFEAQALLALVYAEQKQSAEARHVLLALLTQTRAEGYLRLFFGRRGSHGDPFAFPYSSCTREALACRSSVYPACLSWRVRNAWHCAS